jgi:hypothetical protein
MRFITGEIQSSRVNGFVGVFRRDPISNFWPSFEERVSSGVDHARCDAFTVFTVILPTKVIALISKSKPWLQE